MMDEKALKTLEFDKVLNEIARHANSEVTAAGILAVAPFGSREEIAARSGAVSEIRRLAAEETPLALSRFSDILPALKAAAPEGAFLDGADCLRIREVLALLTSLSTQLTGRDDLPLLGEISDAIPAFPELKKLLDRTFDHEGNVVDGASPALFALRGKIRGLSARIARRLEEIVRDEKVSPFLQDDFITKRGERWVIPVRMDAKGEVSGVVHCVSNSGETAFVEPLEIIGQANELENLSAEEKGEVIRILKGVCRKVREASPELEKAFTILVALDLLNSIALYSDRFAMSAPAIGDGGAIRLETARHPLLLLQQRQGALKEVVPLDLVLDGGDRVMVITGPNAGGKTITIKTIGLLLAMALSGLHVPAGPESRFPLASDLLVDIGDDQSIEAALSTFSAHMTRIAGIIGRAGAGGVALLDEIGTGTEPLQGAAIASAVLKELQARGAIVFATTHLTDIVAFVHKASGMVNASMAFDPGSHLPLYLLKPGEPGESHALETAERCGLPKGVVASAREMMGGRNAELQSLMADLKEKAAAHESARRGLAAAEAAAKERGRQAETRLAEAEAIRRQVRADALKEMKEMIVEARREVRCLIEEGKQKPKAALKGLEEKAKIVEEELAEIAETPPLSPGEVKAGDLVFVKSIGHDAKVAEVDHKRARLVVESGGLRIDVGMAEVSAGSGRKGPSKGPAPKGPTLDADQESTIKLIGLRVEEALQRLEAFLDAAVVSGISEVRIIHGIGTGALLKAVRESLGTYPGVKSFRRGEKPEGGDGVTVALLG